MNWLYKLEYKYGRKAPSNVMLYIVGGQILVWLVVMIAYAPLYNLIGLSRSAVLHGQIWRLVTFVFTPSLTNPLVFALELYLIYMIGTSLERSWGSFKFDAYLVLGVLGAWLACFVTGYSGTGALYYSLFFAFAYLFPEVQLLLFFVLPIKVKWIGWFAGAMYLFNILFSGSLRSSLGLILGLLNFFVFFGKGSITGIKAGMEAKKRRREWQNQWRDR